MTDDPLSELEPEVIDSDVKALIRLKAMAAAERKAKEQARASADTEIKQAAQVLQGLLQNPRVESRLLEEQLQRALAAARRKRG